MAAAFQHKGRAQHQAHLLLCRQVQTTTPQQSRRLRLAAAAAVRTAVDACPALRRDHSSGSGSDDADVVAAWACAEGGACCAGLPLPERGPGRLMGPARRCPGASAPRRRGVGTSAPQRVGAQAPRRPGAQAP